MKKITIFYISYDGALEPIPQSQVIPYLKELSKEGFIFHWLSFDKPNPEDFKRKEELRQDLLRHGIFWHSLTYYRRPYLMAKIFNILCGIMITSFYVLKYNIPVVHCRSEVSATIGSIVKLIFRRKVIYDRRGFMAEDYVEGGMWRSRKSFLYKLLIFIDNTLLRFSDRIVVLTYKMKDWLITNRSVARDKITVIPCCVDLSKFADLQNTRLRAQLGFNGKFIFAYSGSLGTWYLMEQMIDFFLIVKQSIPKAHFLVLTMSDHLLAKNIFRKKSIDADDFTILSVIPNDIPKFVHCADAAICFIKPVLSKVASSPTKFAEFLASGIPIVINSGIGDCDEVVERDRVGIIIRNFSHPDYKNCTNQLLSLMEEKEALKKRCAETARKYFSLTDGAKKYNSVYQSLMQSNAA